MEMMEANMPRSLRIGDAAPNFTARTTQGEIALDQRSEEHTSELQSQSNLVCRLLLEKKKHSNDTQSQGDVVNVHLPLGRRPCMGFSIPLTRSLCLWDGFRGLPPCTASGLRRCPRVLP